jgi:hypothetical protein
MSSAGKQTRRFTRVTAKVLISAAADAAPTVAYPLIVMGTVLVLA